MVVHWTAGQPVKQSKRTLFIFVSIEGRWEVSVQTSDITGAGTEAQVSLTVYGRRSDGTVACSGPQPLGQPGDDGFKQGQMATNEVTEQPESYKIMPALLFSYW